MWEYKTEIIKAQGFWTRGKFDGDGLSGLLNESGKQNWELVSFTSSNVGFGETGYGIAIFKRPL